MFTDPAHRQLAAPPRLRPAVTGTVPPDASVANSNERRVPTLGGMLIAAQEEERSRIARELHDDINQQLALIAIEAQSIEVSADNPSLAVRMHHLWEEVVRVSHDVETVSHELHSSTLQHLGLASALLALSKQVQERQHVVVKFEIHVPVPKLSEEIALNLFRVAQECFRNISKHSGAHTANMRLAARGNNVWLRICDDGVGFRMDSPETDVGLGITSMRERMKMVGGRLTISSHTFRGTCVAAVAPLAAFD